jgi:small basic protein
MASLDGEFFLRAVILAAAIYLIYETLRNWALTQKASQGIVTIGFVFFLIEQLGFIFAMMNFGSVAVFLAYEGRIMGLLLLNAVLIVGIRKDDSVAVLRRLGLGAPAHDRLQQALAR